MTRIFKPDSGQTLEIQDEGGSAALTIETDGNVTVDAGNVVIGTAGKGITFGGDPDSRQNSPTVGDRTLYDYEEGIWTAVLSDGTNNMTMNSSYTTGYYTKIGNLVTVSGFFMTTSLGSASGSIRITGLPFTIANNNRAFTGGGVALGNGFAITAGESISFNGYPNTTNIYLRVWDATTGTTAMQESEWTADGEIIIGFSYRAE